MHLHVGHNSLGNLPDGHVGCVDTLAAAAVYLRAELLRIQEAYLERCSDGSRLYAIGQECRCSWCQVADAAFADSRAASPVWHRLRIEQSWSALYGPRNNPVVHVWVLPAVGDRRDCGTNQRT